MFYLHIHRPECATSWFTFLLFCCIHFKPQSSISKWILNRNATQDFLLPKATTYFVRARIVVNCHLFLSFLQQLLNSLKLRLYLEKTGKFLVLLCSDLPRSQTKTFITMTILSTSPKLHYHLPSLKLQIAYLGFHFYPLAWDPKALVYLKSCLAPLLRR